MATGKRHGQQANMLLNNEQMLRYENLARDKNSNFHSNCKPFVIGELESLKGYDSLQTPAFLNEKYAYKLFNRHGLGITRSLKIDPILTLIGGYDRTRSDKAAETALGASFLYLGKDHFSARYNIAIINAQYPYYMDSVIQKTDIIPQYGYADSGRIGYKTLLQTGYLAYAPNKTFRFEAGNGKHFFGDGYRSLLLSDNANAYPYFKITTTIWKFKYTNLFAELRDIRGSLGNRQLMEKKYAAFHYLSWNVTKRFNFSFFESIVWQSRSKTGGLGYDVNYLNPIVFYRPVEYSVGSPDNALLGASFKLKIAKNIQLYSQVLIDEFYLKFLKERKGWWANKQGYQAGFKVFNLFHLNNLYLQGEANYVRPYTYSHGNSIQNYGHYNQSLAHPLGANFYEAIGIISYQYQLWFFSTKVNYAKVGLDSSNVNYGQNIYASYTTRPSDFGNYVGQGLTTHLIIGEAKVSRLIRPKYNLLLEAGARYRTQQNVLNTNNTIFIFVGIRTALSNLYNDF